MVTETVTVVIVQSTRLKQPYNYYVIWSLTVSVHPLTNIHFVHSQSTTPPYILSISFHEAELDYFSTPYQNLIHSLVRLDEA